MKSLALTAVVLALFAAPAMAQNWTQYQSGDRTFYQSNNGWAGSGYQSGDRFFQNFQSTDGQTRNCTSYRSGDRIYTDCQ